MTESTPAEVTVDCAEIPTGLEGGMRVREDVLEVLIWVSMRANVNWGNQAR